MIDGCEYPSDFLQRQWLSNNVDLSFMRILQQVKSRNITDLGRLINRFDNSSNSSLVIGIFSVIPIKESHFLLRMRGLSPRLDKTAHIFYIHELCKINVSVWLSVDNNIRRQAFIAHSLWPRFMVLTLRVDHQSLLWINY